ncbi:GNAT family N-acetyltransferase [Streptomyces sp. NPDC057445]|uniref:GNAT family N-acetyltransferase n=1 Tax=Streptomyces sp. NPDC057445 TaxID=3346136 RepID=UPI00368AA4D2
MQAVDSLAMVRYGWAAGTGAWAGLRHHWSSAPGRRYPHVVTTPAGRGPTLAYQGFPEGLTYVLPYLRSQQTGAQGASGRPEERAPGARGGALTTEEAPLGWRRIRRGALSPDADILVIGCSRRRAFALPRTRSLVLPFRVHALLDVVGDAEAMHRSVSPNERRQFANLRRKHRWTYERSTSVEDLRFFYERMHRPTMASRHGEETRSTDWSLALRALFRQGVLLFVNEAGKRVAGVLCRTEDGGRTLRMRLLGVLDGDEAHYASGAAKAVYYLTMEWAAGHGVRRIDFAGADPFPGRGVFQFKRRFRPTIAHPEDHYRDRRVYVRVVRDTCAVRDFLVATPMLTVDEAGRIGATYFQDAGRPARLNIRADCPGVHGSHIVDLDAFLGRPSPVRGTSARHAAPVTPGPATASMHEAR